MSESAEDEEILTCECGGNVFQLIKIDDINEIECIGCKKRIWIK